MNNRYYRWPPIILTRAVMQRISLDNETRRDESN